MAFKTNNENASTFKQAEAFANLYVPTKGGGRKKLGAIALRSSDAIQARVIERLTENNEEALKKLIDMIEFEFHLVQEVKDEDIEF